MLQINPKDRITAADALEHPYFNNIPENLRKIYK